MYQKFLELLKKHNVTTYAVSKATGISNACFSEWKHGKSNPKADKLKKIAEFFGEKLDYFY